MDWTRDYLSKATLLPLLLVLALGCQSAPKGGPWDYSAAMTVKRIVVPDQRPAQYMVEIQIWRQRSDGRRQLVSEPQVMLVEGQEAAVEIGSGAEKVVCGEVVVRELDGKKVATATIECFEGGAIVWQRELETEAVPASD
jgi:hypothetical protein